MYALNSLLTQYFVGGDTCLYPNVGRNRVGARRGMCPYIKCDSENGKGNVYATTLVVLVVLVVLVGQLRKVAACEAALERIVIEANEALGSLTFLGRTTSDQVWFQNYQRNRLSTFKATIRLSHV